MTCFEDVAEPASAACRTPARPRRGPRKVIHSYIPGPSQVSGSSRLVASLQGARAARLTGYGFESIRKSPRLFPHFSEGMSERHVARGWE
jgi:hypothetical protein